MAQEEDSLSVNTPFGQIVARGINIVQVLAVVILTWLTYTENHLRSEEHDQIVAAVEKNRETLQATISYQACLQRLNLYVASSKDPSHLTLNVMPQDLWSCLPKFLTEEQQEQRKLHEGH